MQVEPAAEVSASYRIDAERRLVVLTYVGAVRPSHVFAIQGRLRADPAFDPAYGVLFDGLRADLSAFDADSVRRLAQDTPFAPDSPRAFLVTPGLHFALVRMFQSFSTDRAKELVIFEERESALAWLAERHRGPPLGRTT